jgi:hypothetical protein
VHDLLPGAVEAAHDRSLRDPQRTGRFLVGEASDVDGDEDVTEVVGERRHRGVELPGRERGVWPGRLRVGDEIELLGQGAGTEAAALGAPLGQEGVAERAQEVADVVLAAEQARAAEDSCVGLLDEVGVLAGAAERPRGPVEPVDVSPSRVGSSGRAITALTSVRSTPSP